MTIRIGREIGFHTRPHTRIRTLALYHLPLSATLVWSLSAPPEHFLAKDKPKGAQWAQLGVSEGRGPTVWPAGGALGEAALSQVLHTLSSLGGPSAGRAGRRSDIRTSPAHTWQGNHLNPRLTGSKPPGECGGVGGQPKPTGGLWVHKFQNPRGPQAGSNITIQAIT